MRVDNSLISSQLQPHDGDQKYNFRCCICRKLSGSREKEICDLISDDQVASVWDAFDTDPIGMSEHFIVAGDALFFRCLSDKYYNLTCEGPQFGFSLRKIVEKFSVKAIFIEMPASCGSGTNQTFRIAIDGFREILQRRDITLNELRSLIRVHHSKRLRSVCLILGNLLGYAGAYFGTILTITALACAYICREKSPGRLLAVTTVAFHAIKFVEDSVAEPNRGVISWIRRSVEVIQSGTPLSVKKALGLLIGLSASIGGIVLPALAAVAIYRTSEHLAGRLSPVGSTCLNFVLDKADEHPRTTILTVLVVSILFGEVVLNKLREGSKGSHEDCC